MCELRESNPLGEINAYEGVLQDYGIGIVPIVSPTASD